MLKCVYNNIFFKVKIMIGKKLNKLGKNNLRK